MTERVLLDARWIGGGGIGRVTGHLLDGLRELRPDGPWTVWLGEERPVWRGADVALARHRAAAWGGQRCLGEIPPADLAVFPANLRPLRPVGRASMTVLYDTIPLRHEPGRLRRVGLRRLFLRAARLSDRVLTISDHSARCLVRELGLAPDDVAVLPIPFDRHLARLVASRRPDGMAAEPTVVFVGRFAPHKNLERLVRGFARSACARDGGRLVLAGDDGPEADRLRALGAELRIDLDVPGPLTEAQLVETYAGAWAVALVSLDEGLGLPVLEATAAGIPVVASTAGGIAETVGQRIPLVDPLDEAQIADRIDDAIAAGGRIDGRLVEWAHGRPTEIDLARAVVREVDALRRPRTTTPRA